MKLVKRTVVFSEFKRSFCGGLPPSRDSRPPLYCNMQYRYYSGLEAGPTSRVNSFKHKNKKHSMMTQPLFKPRRLSSRYMRGPRSWLTALCVETAEAHHAFPLLVRNAFLCSLNKSNRDGRDFTLRAPLKMGEVSNALFAVCTSDSACRQARCRTTAVSYWLTKHEVKRSSLRGKGRLLHLTGA